MFSETCFIYGRTVPGMSPSSISTSTAKYIVVPASNPNVLAALLA